jgi:thioredoxin 1
MNQTVSLTIGVLVLVVVAGGIYASMGDKDDAMMADQIKDTAMIESANQAAMDKDKTDDQLMMKKDETTIMPASDTMMNTGSYEVYAPDKVALASATHDVVLFFRASWCPTCRAVDADIKTNLSKIPSSLAILDVNYDTASELKKKYGVTYQHTFVQVDTNGNLIKKWSESPTLTALVAEVQKQ